MASKILRSKQKPYIHLLAISSDTYDRLLETSSRSALVLVGQRSDGRPDRLLIVRREGGPLGVVHYPVMIHLVQRVENFS